MNVGRILGALTLLSLIAIGGGGAALGVALGERATEQGVEQLRIVDPLSFDATPATALRSEGGFTGFGGLPALSGDVFRSGRVAESSEGGLLITGEGTRTLIDFSRPLRLFRIVSTPQVVVGDTVLVRRVDGEVTGVLVLPASGEDGAEASAP